MSMTQLKSLAYMLKGALTEFPEDAQKVVYDRAKALRNMANLDSAVDIMAMTLAVADMAPTLLQKLDEDAFEQELDEMLQGNIPMSSTPPEYDPESYQAGHAKGWRDREAEAELSAELAGFDMVQPLSGFIPCDVIDQFRQWALNERARLLEGMQLRVDNPEYIPGATCRHAQMENVIAVLDAHFPELKTEGTD